MSIWLDIIVIYPTFPAVLALPLVGHVNSPGAGPRNISAKVIADIILEENYQ